VITKSLHPKLAHAFGYRLSLSASVHSHTWPVIATVLKWVLLSSSSPVPRSTADENSSHNYFIIEEDSFTVQLTFSDGNCSSSIYFLAFHLSFAPKTKVFVYKLHAYMFVDHAVFYHFGHLKLLRQQKCNHKVGLLSPPNRSFLLHRPPTAHFCFTSPLEFLTVPREAVPPTLGTTVLDSSLLSCIQVSLWDAFFT